MLRSLTLALLILAVSATAASAAWHEVSFAHTLRAADRAALDAAGARAVHPTGARSYAAWLDHAAAARLDARKGTAVRVVRGSAKLAAGLAPGALRAVVVRYRDGERVPDLVTLRPGTSLRRLLSAPDVLSVGPAPTRFTFEDEGTAQLLAGNEPAPGYLDLLAGLGFNGAGVRIAIVDTGIDERHPDIAERVVDSVSYFSPDPSEDTDGHGTHVSGIVAGMGVALQGASDLDGVKYGVGVAPGADLIAQNGIATLAPGPKDMLPQLAFDAVSRGAVAWNASWHTGEGTGIGYVENSRALDSLVRDADRAAPGAQPLAMVFSAGNAGSGDSTITSPKEAKNIITVASSLSHRGLPTGPEPDTNEISSFSSRGPARDGRILPTVAAPGEGVISARANFVGGLCFEPAPDGASPYHSSCSGTSMASPHVAGAVALMTQWWRGFNAGANPSPAMIKALLVNTATDLGAKDVPNSAEGWGRVNTGTLLEPASRHYVDQSDIFTNPGELRTLRLAPVDPAQPLRVSLVWSDAPGAPPKEDADPVPPALVNDLDLSLTGPDGTVYWGNQFENGASKPGGGPDRLNNLENVFLDRAAGVYTLTVNATALPGDGVPFTGDTTDQDYALVVSNAKLAPAVVAAPPPVAAAAPARYTVRALWRKAGRRTTLRTLTVTGLPAGSRAGLACRGGGCPKRSLTRRGTRVDLTSLLRGRRLARRARVTLKLTLPGSAARTIRWTIGKPGRPARRG